MAEKTVIGPTLPSDFKRAHSESESSESVDSNESSDNECTSAPSIGPVLPKSLAKKLKRSVPAASFVEREPTPEPEEYGPALPPELQALADDSIVIGPVLPSDDKESPADYERRLQRIRNAEFAKSKPGSKREQWMMELPSAKEIKALGLQASLKPRTFIIRPTDVIRDDTADAFSLAGSSEADRKKEEISRELGKSRSQQQSLMDAHTAKRRAAGDDEAEADSERIRRPFNRDEDLKVSGLTKTDREEILAKAKNLNSRFSSGKTKFI